MICYCESVVFIAFFGRGDRYVSWVQVVENRTYPANNRSRGVIMSPV